MNEVLRNYTTIPAHLYVHRSADHQLRKILQEMDRPGYVLVARQMGKTNLLFNAKRELECSSTIFAYVDLSNYFSQERDCYRNIIDCIIDPNDNYFSDLYETLYRQRETSVVPPHKEHLKELRQVLNHFKGKIVIILDEIDALKNAPYSDHIFAQIRSNYFARTNYPELNNLTYILSGVIEPTELIKDKNKSPFNIGEKIYLDDFSFSEFEIFLKQSGVAIDADIAEHVYWWTSGNPRLTFDICVELSELIAKSTSLTRQVVDEVIFNKYLVSFDIAPVDHIREVVKENSFLRKAILKIHRSKTDDLDDETKQKLYLYGITNHDVGSSPLKIKNRILERSLSIEWLNSLDQKVESLFDIGAELIIDDKNYREGIKVLEEYLSSASKVPDTRQNLVEYYMGFSYHHLQQYEESNKYLKPEPMSYDTSPDLHYRQKLFIGLNHIALNETPEGIGYLEEIVNNYKKGTPYANALINLSSTLADEDFENNSSRSLTLLDELIEISDKLNFDDEADNVSSNEFTALAFYNKANIFLKQSLKEEAIMSLKEATNICELSFKPSLMFRLYELTADNELLNEIRTLIIENNLKFDGIRSHPLTFSENLLYRIILSTFKANNIKSYQKLSNYALDLTNETHKEALILKLSLLTNSIEVNIGLFEPILSEESSVDQSMLLKIYRRLSILSWQKHKDFRKFFLAYVKTFKVIKNKHLDVQDISAFNIGIRSFYDNDRVNEAIELSKIIEARFVNLSDELTLESAVIYYWQSNLYHTLKNRAMAVRYAETTLRILDESNIELGSTIDQKGKALIKERMNFIKNNFAVRAPIIIAKKYGRNDKITVKYSDGLIAEGKYKKFEVDINEGKCEIVE